ncbi:hypothetical protein G7046_g406 [Stylonectria norvegica]|nr:hypothetical protein G7046_g406 [Stylonectria norvegica]
MAVATASMHLPAKIPSSKGGCIQDDIMAICSQCLHRPISRINAKKSFLAQGGDSLLAIKLMARCREIGYTISIQDILEAKSIAELGKYAEPMDGLHGEVKHSDVLNMKSGSLPPLGPANIQETNIFTPGTQRSRSCKLQGVPADFPLMDVTKEDYDNLISSKLKRITPDPVRNVEDVFPCSANQEVFLTAQEINPDMYQCSGVVEIKSAIVGTPLNYDRLVRAWGRLVSQHGVLRTVFIDSVNRLGHFDQVVLRDALIDLEVVGDADEVSTKLQSTPRYTHTSAKYHATHRATLFRRSDYAASLKLEISHALIDGESVNVLLQHLSHNYQDHTPTAIAMVYQDFISYQQQLSLEDSVNYWSTYLEGASPSFLPAKNDEPKRQNIGTVRTRIDFGSGSLEKLCGQFHVTAANICQVAWALVLRSYTGSDDICFSYASSGREAALNNIENAIGAFVDTKLFRLKMSDEMTVASTLSVAKDHFIAGLSRQGISVTGRDNQERKFSRLRGNTIMTFQQSVSEKFIGESALVFDIHDAYSPSEYDITLYIQTDHDGLTATIDFWKSHMDEGMVESILQSFEKAVKSMSRGDASLDNLDVIPSPHIERIRKWNQNHLNRAETLIHDRVTHQRLLQPTAFAVQGWDGDLTYEELDDEANKMASYLVSLGVGPESKVAFCFEKSKWAVVSQLGILKAGGCVVPFSAKQPMERIRTILENAQCAVLLTGENFEDVFSSILPSVVAIGSAFMSQLSKSAAPLRRASPDNLAFVIHTSGSTGIPKGVMLTHSNICANVQYFESKLNIGPHSRVLQFSDYTFDVSIGDVFGTWYHGGCLCLISEEDRYNNLGSSLQTYEANHANLTPTVAATLVPHEVPCLKSLALMGEAVGSDVFDLWINHVALYNCYGPAECTILTTYHLYTPECDARNIGRATTTAVWVVDMTNHNRLVPIGAPGELLVEGPQVSSGYLNDEQNTAAGFIISPSWKTKYCLGASRRLYRTGDLVQQLQDGSLLYLGRRDTQIKVHGQRVEMGEIEHAVKRSLPEAEDVAAFLVVSKDNRRGPIIAVSMEVKGKFNLQGPSTGLPSHSFLSVTSDLRRSLKRLRISLFDLLPSHMIPKLYVPTTAFPQTTSSKIDRRLLQQSLQMLSEKDLSQYILSDAEKVTPTTDTQERLQRLWAEVLGVTTDEVGILDHFLHMGGDSFTAMRLVALSNKPDCNISFSVSDVFRHPKLIDLARFIDQSTQVNLKTADIGRFGLWKEGQSPLNSLEDELRQLAGQCGVSVDDIEDVYPCTPLQEGLMATTAQQPRAYVACRPYRVPDTIDSTRLRDAWQALSRKVPIFRTRIVPGRLSGALQVVIQHDLEWCTHSDLGQYLADNSGHAMAYGLPLVRLGFIEAAQNERYFVLTAHHSTYDGWSLAKVSETLTRLYAGQEIPDAPPFTLFIDYIEQQDQAPAKVFWKSQLSGGLGKPFPTLPNPAHEPQPLHNMTCQLKTGPLRGSITLATILRAAWALVISAHSDNNAQFAMPLTGRTAPISGVQEMIAPTITTVPIVIRIDTKQPIYEYLKSVHQQAVEMMPFEQTGMQNISRMVGSSINPGHLFVVQRATESEDVAVGGPLGLEPIEIPMQFGGYALTVECMTGDADDAGVEVVVRFDQAVISNLWMQRILDRFRHIFAQLLSEHNNPDERGKALIGDIEMVSPEEITQLLRWNEGMPEQEQTLVHEKVYEQCLNQPHAPAVSSWDGDFTYSQLNALSERLAHHLIHLGVGPEVMVTLCFDKSKWAVVSIFAVLKAGGVVVPVRADPISRLQTIIQETDSQFVLASTHYRTTLRNMARHVLMVDGSFLDGLPRAIKGIHQQCRPNNASFVIFTSGSTGTPKGTVIEHCAMSASVQAQGMKFGVNPNTRAFQFSHFTFDMSLHDILTPLFFGGCVCLPSEEDRVNNLAGSIRSMDVNYLALTPRVLSILKPSDIPKVQTFIVGGEALQSEHVDPWIGVGRVFNAYGPAECSIMSTAAEILEVNQTPRIGHALACRFWVVGETDYNSLVPIGAVGELLIEGPILARGYLNDSAKTLTAFIKDPAWLKQYELDSGKHERRMYRTGDLVIQNDDGSLTYVGRSDNQIKIRGQRVEIGEIEHHLAQRPTIADAVVLFPKQGPSRARLVAVLTFDGFVSGAMEASTALHPIELDQLPEASQHVASARQHLLSCVPSYMAPDVWICLESMPQNPSRKIDRKRLTAWLEGMDSTQLKRITRKAPGDGDSHEAEKPLNDSERKLQSVLAEVLKIPLGEVVMNHSFLGLGGDSVTAMQFVSQCRLQHGTSVSIQDILQATSISQLAEKTSNETPSESIRDPQPFSLYGTAGPTNDDLARLALRYNCAPEAIEDVYPCTPLQEGLLALTARQHDAYVNRWVFQLGETVSIDAFKQAWQQVFDKAPILRSRIVEDGKLGIMQATICEHIKWLAVNSELEDYLIEDRSKGMGFGTPLARLAIVRTKALGQLFVWTAHHAIYDGWSFRKLLETVSSYYFAKPPPTFAPFTRFIDHLQRTNSESATKTYWQSQLKHSTGSLITTLQETRKLKTYRKLQRRIVLPLWTKAITAATMLRASWALVLAAENSSKDVVFPTSLSGRTSALAGILDVMGPTIATVPVRIRVNGEQSVREYLDTVQKQSVEMMPFEHTGLQNIRRMVTDATLEFNHLFVIQPWASHLDQVDAIFPGTSLLPDDARDALGYPLLMECYTGGNELNNIELQALFDENALPIEKMDMLLARFQHILTQLAQAAGLTSGDTNRRVSSIELVSPQDITQIHRWNQSCQPQAGVCVHELFRQRRISRPDAPAVCAWDGELSYSQLDASASRLAYHLMTLGVGPETPVAVMFEKSMWAIVAQLAILMSGGTVVPINHHNPMTRMQSIFSASGATIILTSLSNDRYQGLQGPVSQVITVDDKFLAQLPDGPELANGTVKARNSAFIIFTSDDPGIPTGVVLEHGSVVTSLLHHGAHCCEQSARVLQYAAYTSHASVTEVFSPLIVGGCICIASENDCLSNLAGAMEQLGVTNAMLTPNAVSLLKPLEVPSLDNLVFIGEPLKTEVLSQWIGRNIKLFNAFGPTECSIITTLNGPVKETGQESNIGATFNGMNLWVVDSSDYQRLVPVGSVGELLIEGPMLARGYLGNEEKTAAQFVTDPAWSHGFEAGAGRRFFRTGDLVRQKPDRSMVYIGRRDTQIRIRGQRVEVGEIESWAKEKLGERSEVMVSLVTPKQLDIDEDLDDKHLTAIIEMGKITDSDTSSFVVPMLDSHRRFFSDLRHALLEVLPSYMVPKLYIPVSKLPLTESGKLDRKKAMRLLQGADSLSDYLLKEEAKVLPSTTTETQLQELWGTALKVETTSIGVKDDFFGSGGDSVSAMRLVASARQKYHLTLTVADIFRHPVLSDLAAVVDRQGPTTMLLKDDYEPFSAISILDQAAITTDYNDLLGSECGKITDAAPTTDVQAAFVMATLNGTRDMLAYVNLDGDGICDVGRWKACCLELIKMHEVLRTSYVLHNKQLFQVVLQEYEPEIRHYITKRPFEQFTEQLVARDMDRPPQLGQPFTEFVVITSKSNTDLRHRIVFRLSHGEYDAISLSYFTETLQALYDGTPVQVYHPFCRYVQSLSAQSKEAGLSYWQKLLRGSTMPRLRPVSKNNPPTHTNLIHHPAKEIKLDRNVQPGVSLSTIVRAAWACALVSHCGKDVVFGETVTGRNSIGSFAEKVAGCCINLVPVRLNMVDSWTIRDLLHHLQEQQLSRLPYENLGFREILGFCTGAEPTNTFSSHINHVHRDLGEKLKFGEIAYDLSIAFRKDRSYPVDIVVDSIAKEGHVKISVGYLEGVIATGLVEKLYLATKLSMSPTNASKSHYKSGIELTPRPLHGITQPRASISTLFRYTINSSLLSSSQSFEQSHLYFESQKGLRLSEMPLIDSDTPPATNDTHYIAYFASGEPSWCPDCRDAVPALKTVFEGAKKPTAYIVRVGTRPEWQGNSKNKYRQAPYNIRGVPTVVRIENGIEVARLGDESQDVYELQKLAS